jgi:PAS domain S-box-containing protein
MEDEHITLIEEQGRKIEELRQKIVDLEASLKEAGQIEKALRANEGRFRSYFELGLIGMAITSPAKRMIEVNDELCAMLGYDREELSKMTWVEFTHPSDLSTSTAFFDRVLAGEIDGFSIDKRLIRKNGQTVYATISVKCLRRADGSVDHLVVLLQDITERRSAQEALQKREESFRALAENAPAVIERLDKEGRHLFVNLLAARLHGKPAEAIVGKTNREIGIPEHYCKFWKERIQRVFETGRALSEESEFPTTEGQRIFESRFVPEKARDGTVTSVLMVSRDITDRKRTEELLQEYQKAIEGSQDIVAVVDRSYRYLIANKAFLKYRDASREQVIGRPVSEVLGKDIFDQRIKKHLDSCFNGKAVQYEMKNTYPGLGERDLLVSYFPIDSPDGINRVVGVIRDITELKRMEETLRETEVRRRLHAKILVAQDNERKLLAHEIHDGFVSQLATVKYRVEEVIRKADQDANGKAEESLRGIIPILQDCIVEARRMQMNLWPPVLDDLGVLPTIEWFCREFEQTHPNIKVERDMDVQELDILPSLKTVIYSVLQEAVNNIAKYSKADYARLSLKIIEGNLELLVHNKGKGFDGQIGVDPGNSNQGFELAAMKERTEISGGSFSVASNPEEGTTIKASWPLRIAE